MEDKLKLLNDKFEKRGHIWYGQYKCFCGNIKIIRNYHVKSGNIKSCGCNKVASQRKAVTKHGMCYTRLYNIYGAIKKRCFNIKDEHYKNYGARGITLCNEWKNSFEAFMDWAMNNGYSENLQIDRTNNNGNYEPSNCHWTTVKINALNRRTSLSKENIIKIKELIKDNLSNTEIHKRLGNSKNTIRLIRNGEIHKEIN